jgi:hypothetical protein
MGSVQIDLDGSIATETERYTDTIFFTIAVAAAAVAVVGL